mmetsp:Transcript_5553/g.12322  ORF Transcript_5553/g.12322 Transcript_5553/m.12322 type:complete len:106 (-) Transcript_5553:341-658(-)|eukprot:CAMPEP_0116836978 /NCGR_PEP_ID=MMETSP0418-20121206/8399_1 /TAXON_ID=1158023 /ORGANISM="Astrosyne radiata, Strain 13vi08-1A" /LENGTH=105 /DNA_ID=CAMNT_0004466813 /DNA_START=64 /DNA_END=381 /DNA_ORIENTATION=+
MSKCISSSYLSIILILLVIFNAVYLVDGRSRRCGIASKGHHYPHDNRMVRTLSEALSAPAPPKRAPPPMTFVTSHRSKSYSAVENVNIQGPARKLNSALMEQSSA